MFFPRFFLLFPVIQSIDFNAREGKSRAKIARRNHTAPMARAFIESLIRDGRGKKVEPTHSRKRLLAAAKRHCYFLMSRRFPRHRRARIQIYAKVMPRWPTTKSKVQNVRC